MESDAPVQQPGGMRSIVNGAVTMMSIAAVAVVAAAFARAFRASVLWVAEELASTEGGQLNAARSLGRVADGALVAVGIVCAAWIGRLAHRRYDGRVGLRAIAAAATIESPMLEPSAPGTALRTGATWMASASLSSIGREAAIIEAGAIVGATAGRLTRRPHHRLAMTGVASAFAVAYHAPFAAVLYVEEHLGVRRDRRAVAHVLAGSAIGFFLARWWFGSELIFPAPNDPLSLQSLVLIAVVFVPAYLASRTFVAVRERVAIRHQGTPHVWRSTVVLAIGGGLTIAVMPMAVGNGMETLRLSATTLTASVAMALLVGKLVATSATVGAGVPGGVMSPSLAVAGGAALAALLLLDELGVHLAGSWWDAVLVAMSVGVAVSIEAPLVALLMVPEMCGDLRLVPLTAVAVCGAVALERLVEGRRRVVVHDVDA